MKKNLIIKKNLENHLSIFLKNSENIEKKAYELSKIIIRQIKKGKKILICGNGGSAADAQHISTELTVRLAKNRKALPALALTTDTSAITATGNDFTFDKIFSRQVEALGKEGDILIAISTSGNSRNIVNAIKIANNKKIFTFGILGNNGGNCKNLCKDNFKIEEKIPHVCRKFI